MTFSIITDSCCDLPYTWLKEHHIPFISMSVMINGKEYLDDLGEKFTADWMIDQLKNGAMPTTSQINVGRYQEFFLPFVKAGTPILYLCFSSGMSGSYNSAEQAVELIKEDYPDADITVVDTLNASLGEGLLVYYASKMQEEGKSLQEIADWVTEYRQKLHAYVKVEDLAHLQRGGRISKTAAVLGGLMNINPLIVVDRAGSLQNVGKVRGTKRVLEELANETVSTIVDPEDQIILIAHSDDLENAETLKAKILEKIKVKDVIIHPLGSTISSHTGLGCIAIFSLGTERVNVN